MKDESLEEGTQIETLTLLAEDGRALGADIIHPGGEVRASLVIHGATAVPRKHYLPFATFLATHGIRTLIYDYRGVGGSASKDHRKDPATMSDWFTLDAPAAVRALVARDPNVPLLAIGHSFGGQIVAGLADVPTPTAIATMGAQRGYWATFPWHVRPRMWVNWFVLLPALTAALGYLPAAAGLGADMPKGIMLEWAKWCRNPRYYLDDHPELGARIGRFDGRLFAMSVTDDDFAPFANVRWLLDLHARASVEHMRFAPRDLGVPAFGHFGFFRKAYETSVWREVLGFFEESLGTGRRPRAFGRPVRDVIDDHAIALDLSYGRG